MRKVAIILVAVASLLACTASSAKAAVGGPDYPYCDPDDYACLYDTLYSGEATTPPVLTEDLQLNQANCTHRRTIHAGRYGKNYVGLLQWRIMVYVQWCYNGVKVQSLHRYYAIDTGLTWEFKGIVGGNCSPIDGPCTERAGMFGASVVTETLFQVCIPIPFLGSICYHKYPWVQLNVNANGSWSKATWQ